MCMCVCPTLCNPMDPTLCDPMDCSSPGSFYSWNFPGKNTAAGCHFLLQGISQTQGSNLCLLQWQVDALPLAPPGKFSRNLLRWIYQEGNGYFRLFKEGHAKREETYSLLQRDMVVCKLKKWFNTNRRQQIWTQSAHPAGLAEDKFCVSCIRVDWGTEGTSAWILSQNRHKENLLRPPRCSNLPNWCLA